MIIFRTILFILIILLLLYLFLIAPRIVHRPDLTPFLEWHYAHRGLHDNESDAPENSMKAFKKAIDAGFGIELDIQLTKDDVIVVAHDFDLKRICGVDKKICELTYDELQAYGIYGTEEKIPRFTDFLALVDGQVPLIIEYKSQDTKTKLFELADAVLRDYHGIYCVESFNPLLVRWYKKHHPKIMRGILSESYRKDGVKTLPAIAMFVLEYMLLNVLGRPDFIAYKHEHYKNISRQLCRKLFKATSVAWTIKSEHQLQDRAKDYDLFIFEGFVPDTGK